MTKPLFGIQIPRRFPPQIPSLLALMKISPISTFSLNGGLDNTDRYYNYGYQDASGWSTRPTCVNSSYNGAGGGISPFSSEVVVCGHCLVTLSLTINETLKWLSSLPISMQESFWW